MQATHFIVGGCFIGLGRGYIYILYTKVERQLYIGQTNERGGVIGRLADHIGSSGTFRSRLNEHGYDLDKIHDLHVFAYLLPNDPRFTGTNRTHREGVEYLVQKRLHSLRGKLNPPMKIVSFVDPKGAAEQVVVRRVADQVIEAFLGAY